MYLYGCVQTTKDMAGKGIVIFLDLYPQICYRRTDTQIARFDSAFVGGEWRGVIHNFMGGRSETMEPKQNLQPHCTRYLRPNDSANLFEVYRYGPYISVYLTHKYFEGNLAFIGQAYYIYRYGSKERGETSKMRDIFRGRIF